MRRIIGSWLLAALCLLLLASCGAQGWQGFDKEDLSAYLTLGNYKGLPYTDYDTAVTKDEVEAAIRQRLEAATPLTPADAPVADGLTVTFDRFCFLNGVSTPSLSEEGGTYRVGTRYEDAAVNSLLEQMKGMKLGDTAELTVTLHEGYLSAGSSSCDAVYRVTVRAVYEKKLPALTDAVASRLMAGVKTADELRMALREKLEAEKRTEADYRIEAELWQALLEESQVISHPAELYRLHYDELYGNYQDLADAVTMELDAYLSSYLGMTAAELGEKLQAETEAAVKERLVLHAVAKAEGLGCTEEEVKAFADLRATEGSIFESGTDYLAFYGTETVTEQLLKEKVLSLMKEAGIPTR
ncbi:MAG: hypothetical protein IJD10_07275 [Clostridia bacterium]|nr:hypothetical protein [Clostridia bacterium]